MSTLLDGAAPPGATSQAGFAGQVQVALEAGRGGTTRLTRLRCSGALAARPTPAGLYLLSTAAHPVGDDVSRVDIALGADVTLAVRSTGATLARRGSSAGASTAQVRATVAEGATLSWLVEPGIAAAGARHVAVTTVSLARSSRLAWREEVVLGRHGDTWPGSWRTRLEIRRDDAPLLVTDLALGPAAGPWESASVLGGARALAGLVLVDPAVPEESWPRLAPRLPGARGAALPLAGPGIELLAWGDELTACRALVHQMLSAVALQWLPRDVVPSPSVHRQS